MIKNNLIKMILLGMASSFITLHVYSKGTDANSLLNPQKEENSSDYYPIPSDSDTLFSFGSPIKNQLYARKFSFLIWNLHKGADSPLQSEYLELAKGKDIILTQEIFLDQNMMGIFKKSPLHHHVTATSFFSGDDKNVRTGVANISPIKTSAVNFIRTQNLEPIAKTPKMSLITRYPIHQTGKELTVINVHAINFVSINDFDLELHRIFELIKDIASPLVLAGDFNTWNTERLQILSKYCQKKGLLEASFFPDNRMRFNKNPLDHFFHTPDLKIISARAEKNFKGSDHKPLLIDVEYSP